MSSSTEPFKYRKVYEKMIEYKSSKLIPNTAIKQRSEEDNDLFFNRTTTIESDFIKILKIIDMENENEKMKKLNENLRLFFRKYIYTEFREDFHTIFYSKLFQNHLFELFQNLTTIDDTAKLYIDILSIFFLDCAQVDQFSNNIQELYFYFTVLIDLIPNISFPDDLFYNICNFYINSFQMLIFTQKQQILTIINSIIARNISIIYHESLSLPQFRIHLLLDLNNDNPYSLKCEIINLFFITATLGEYDLKIILMNEDTISSLIEIYGLFNEISVRKCLKLIFLFLKPVYALDEKITSKLSTVVE